jgi:glutamate dehydrogenase
MGNPKNWAFANVLKTSLADDEANRPLLDAYFPKRLRGSFRDHFVKHPLRREIIGTAAVNYVVNKAGLRFLAELVASSGRDIGAVMQAYLTVDREAGADEARERVQAGGLAPAQEYEALLRIERALERATREALTGRAADVKDVQKALAAIPASA